ncbi:hypothetical protein Lal_00042675 [Lupinus albus]|nr:hypothetical protein Lal_00042675 [Lupinus albus]
MSLAALFGKLQENELELIQLDQHEQQEKKRKNISLRAKAETYESSTDESNKEDMEDMSMLDYQRNSPKAMKFPPQLKTSIVLNVENLVTWSHGWDSLA